MLEMNKVFLTGNLTRDPELKYLPSGTAVADLRLAVNRRVFDRSSGERKDETVFVDVTAWEKTAEFCKNYLHKGSGIFVEGRLKQDSWQDKETGKNQSKISVVAERIQFAESKNQSNEGGMAGGGGESPSRPTPAASSGRSFPERQAPNAGPPASEPGSTEDDLPF